MYKIKIKLSFKIFFLGGGLKLGKWIGKYGLGKLSYNHRYS